MFLWFGGVPHVPFSVPRGVLKEHDNPCSFPLHACRASGGGPACWACAHAGIIIAIATNDAPKSLIILIVPFFGFSSQNTYPVVECPVELNSQD
jgi:hypothetical protein